MRHERLSRAATEHATNGEVAGGPRAATARPLKRTTGDHQKLHDGALARLHGAGHLERPSAQLQPAPAGCSAHDRCCMPGGSQRRQQSCRIPAGMARRWCCCMPAGMVAAARPWKREEEEEEERGGLEVWSASWIAAAFTGKYATVRQRSTRSIGVLSSLWWLEVGGEVDPDLWAQQ